MITNVYGKSYDNVHPFINIHVISIISTQKIGLASRLSHLYNSSVVILYICQER